MLVKYAAKNMPKLYQIVIKALTFVTSKALNGSVRFGFWTEPKKPEPNRNRTENPKKFRFFQKKHKRSNSASSSDWKWANYSSLDSSHWDDSNGGIIMSFWYIYGALSLNIFKFSLRICYWYKNHKNMILLPFESP